ncbi:MAG: TRAP transporter small permease subunit [Gammaproteobacteria bacterium]|nr:TRAP transporter small permease subunit [Gammaproteobacteria bacterium]
MIESISTLLRRIESGVLVVLLSTMIGIAVYQVVARNLFETGIFLGDALVRVLVLWVTLVGAMVASRNDEHIRMDLLTRFIGEASKPTLKRIANGFTCVVCGIFAWHSYLFVLSEYEVQVLAFAWVPAWICEAIMPVGAGVMCLRYFFHTIDPP